MLVMMQLTRVWGWKWVDRKGMLMLVTSITMMQWRLQDHVWLVLNPQAEVPILSCHCWNVALSSLA